MHVSQIWNIWKYRKARCLMHSSAQYRWYKIQEINKKRIKTKILSVNEKIYIFIWFWLLFLGFLSSVVIVYRIVIVFSPYIRAFVLRLRYRQAFVVFSCFFILILIQESKERMYRHHHWQKLCWRLVPLLPSRTKHRFSYFQGEIFTIILKPSCHKDNTKLILWLKFGYRM